MTPEQNFVEIQRIKNNAKTIPQTDRASQVRSNDLVPFWNSSAGRMVNIPYEEFIQLILQNQFQVTNTNGVVVITPPTGDVVTLARIATTGNYNDLVNKPQINNFIVRINGWTVYKDLNNSDPNSIEVNDIMERMMLEGDDRVYVKYFVKEEPHTDLSRQVQLDKYEIDNIV